MSVGVCGGSSSGGDTTTSGMPRLPWPWCCGDWETHRSEGGVLWGVVKGEAPVVAAAVEDKEEGSRWLRRMATRDSRLWDRPPMVAHGLGFWRERREEDRPSPNGRQQGGGGERTRGKGEGAERGRDVEKGKRGGTRREEQEERWSKGENSMREANTEDNDFRGRRQRGRGGAVVQSEGVEVC